MLGAWNARLNVSCCMDTLKLHVCAIILVGIILFVCDKAHGVGGLNVMV